MTIEQLLHRVRVAGAKQDAFIYNILFRNAGVGVHWYEEKRANEQMSKTAPGVIADRFDVREHTKAGLVIYRYRRTLREALRYELQRLKAATK